MKLLGLIFVSIFLLSGCEESLDTRFGKMDVDYPDRLKFDSNSRFYLGAPYLEFREDKIGDLEYAAASEVGTFSDAFAYAKNTLSDYFTPELIEKQMPLLIDYRNGIWIVNGSLNSEESDNSVVTGGVVEIAFLEETGKVLYIFHSL